MTRARREKSPSGIYHVIIRGIGRRMLFEDDDDRSFFLGKLFEYSNENNAALLAWCLMENHVHMLLGADMDDLEALMRSLDTSFARFYNGRHGHVGPVFQDRYKSIPVATDVQLLETIRYIHHNPQAAGICAYHEYEWSSYISFLNGSPHLNAARSLEIFGDKDAFVEFHRDVADAQSLVDFATCGSDSSPSRTAMSDGRAIELAKTLFGDKFASVIDAMPKNERNASIARLRGLGLSVRQVERITGIGRGIIQACTPGTKA